MSALSSPTLAWQEISWPRTVSYEALIAGLRHLTGSREVPLILRTEGAHGGVRHLVGARHPRAARRLLQHLPGALAEAAEPSGIGSHRLDLALRFSTRQRAVRDDAPESGSSGLIRALAAAARDESVRLEWALLSPLAPMTAPPGLGRDLSLSDIVSAPLISPPVIDRGARRTLAAKREHGGWRAVGRLSVEAPTSRRRRSLAMEILAALRALESPDLRIVARRRWRSTLGTAGPFTARPVALGVREVPLLAAWPLGEPRGLPITQQTSRQLPADTAMPELDLATPQRLVGVGRRAGLERALVLRPRDATRHLLVTGPTGAGKSTMLTRLIQADMAAGRSVVVFDPKSDLIEDVLRLVPKDRSDDVVVLDPTSAQPVGVNPLAAQPGTDPELLADELLGTLHELFAGSWGVRTQDALHACLLALARRPGSSLALVPLMLSNGDFRSQVLAGLDDPLGAGAYWHMFEALSPAERAQQIGPVGNKLRQLLNRSALRAMIGQGTPRFDLSEVFRSPKIVLVDLAKGRVGSESAALVGALAWSSLWQSALGQSRLPSDRRRLVMVYADEFADYMKLPVSFTDMLIQSRGLGVGLTVSHQHLGQLSPEVREACLANCGSKVAFQLLAGDAGTLSRLGGDLEPADFASLDAYEIYASLRVASRATGWMSGRTLPPPDPIADPARLRRLSAERYGVSRDDTEAALRALLSATPGTGADPIGVRPRRAGGRG